MLKIVHNNKYLKSESEINTLGKFENAASFLRVGLPSTLIHHENGAFRKRPSNGRNLKTPGFCFRIERKHCQK